MAVSAIVVAGAPSTRADAPLAGTWSAGPLSELVTVTSWVDACGPRPKSGGSSGGIYRVTSSGDELVFSGSPPFRTDLCWERGTVRRVSHSTNPTQHRWQTRCESNAGDTRKVTVKTTVQAPSDDVIALSEAAHYEWAIGEGTCAADVERTRTWRLVARDGATAATTSGATSTTATAATAPTSSPTTAPTTGPAIDCSAPGDPASIDVQPHHKLARAGDVVNVHVRVFDARGCELSSRPTFRISTADGEAATAVSVDGAGHATISSEAAVGTTSVIVESGGRSARMDIEIVSDDRYAQLIAGDHALDGGTDDSTGSAIVAEAATATLGATSAVVRGNDRPTEGRTIAFIAVGGGITVLLGLSIALMRRRPRKKSRGKAGAPSPKPVELPAAARAIAGAPVAAVGRLRVNTPPAAIAPSAGPAAPDFGPVSNAFASPNADARRAAVEPARRGDFAKMTIVGVPGATFASPAAPPQPAQPDGRICSKCGLRYPLTAEFCTEDGTRLAAPVPAQPVARGLVCPTCGRQYEAGASFCARDGVSLVPEN